MTRTPLPLLVSFALLTACNIKEDREEFNELDRLRVMAVQVEPAQVPLGETATLRALVYDPAGRDITYEWSWCPVRNGSGDGFSCALPEDELQEVWDALGTRMELPPYDLGDGESAEFDNVFAPDMVAGLCQVLIGEQTADERAILACLLGLDISVQVVVRAGGDELVVLRTVELADADVDPEDLNHNPEVSAELEVSLRDDEDASLDADTLIRGEVHKLIAMATEDQAETFLPEKRDGLDAPTARRETLFMEWFITAGQMEEGDEEGPRDDDDGGGGRTTTYVDGGDFAEDLLENYWDIRKSETARSARLFMVLHDERGGVGWAEHSFDIGAAQ